MRTEEIIEQAKQMYYINSGHFTKRQCAESVPTPKAEYIRDVCNLFDITYVDYIEGEI
jgi:hypothetical protein